MDHIRNADLLSELLDNKFSLIGVRFGIDPLLNFIPVGGNMIGLMFATYILWIATQEGVSWRIRQRMVLNVIVDFLLGFIPFIGWVGDFFIRSNIRNMKLMHDYLDKRPLEGKIIASQEVLSGG